MRAILDQAQVERVGLVVSGLRGAGGGYEYYGGVDTEVADQARGRRGCALGEPGRTPQHPEGGLARAVPAKQAEPELLVGLVRRPPVVQVIHEHCLGEGRVGPFT